MISSECSLNERQINWVNDMLNANCSGESSQKSCHLFEIGALKITFFQNVLDGNKDG